jgi:hypothetical protein
MAVLCGRVRNSTPLLEKFVATKLYIPPLGTLLVLAEDWTFKLQLEYRNKDLVLAEAEVPKKSVSRYFLDMEKVLSESGVAVLHERPLSAEELEQSYVSFRATRSRAVPYIEVTLPKGTQLKVDRIYIRQGAEAFNSVTFRTTKQSPNKKYASKRFWVKLQDANRIVADII